MITSSASCGGGCTQLPRADDLRRQLYRGQTLFAPLLGRRAFSGGAQRTKLSSSARRGLDIGDLKLLDVPPARRMFSTDDRSSISPDTDPGHRHCGFALMWGFDGQRCHIRF
jgi:hypothetical protein